MSEEEARYSECMIPSSCINTAKATVNCSPRTNCSKPDYTHSRPNAGCVLNGHTHYNASAAHAAKSTDISVCALDNTHDYMACGDKNGIEMGRTINQKIPGHLHDTNTDVDNSTPDELADKCVNTCHSNELFCTEDGRVDNASLDGNSSTTHSNAEHDAKTPYKDLCDDLAKNCISHTAKQQERSADTNLGIEYVVYQSELQMPDIMRLITKDLSEPYSIYTYRYFIHNWPKLCFLAMHRERCVGAIVCKLDLHKKMIRRGYIAMLAVDNDYRRLAIGSHLVMKAIRAMVTDECDEVVLETEITNKAALRLYENLGFVHDKRLFRYYLNGVDALRLKLWLR